MSYTARRLPSRKRKETDSGFPSTSAKPLVPVARAVTGKGEPSFNATSSSDLLPISNNKLLAGYMAHEFLTKGTLFGQRFDPARAEAVPLGSDHDPRRMAEPANKTKPKPESYAEVANLMRSDGAHVPGVVNPTQLARWISWV